MPAALPFASCCTGCAPCAPQNIVPVQTIGTSLVIVPNVEDGRAINPDTLSQPAEMHTQGAQTAGDGFQKVWWWYPDSFDVDDGSPFTVVIMPVNRSPFLPGRWLQTSLV